MFELELDQAAELIADTNTVIAEYYDSHDGIKDKIELIRFWEQKRIHRSLLELCWTTF